MSDKPIAPLQRYEPTVVVEESRGRTTATGAAMEPKGDGRWVRLRDVESLPGMSEMNRHIAYSAAAKLRELGYEWDEKREWIAACGEKP